MSFLISGRLQDAVVFECLKDEVAAKKHRSLPDARRARALSAPGISISMRRENAGAIGAAKHFLSEHQVRVFQLIMDG